MSVDTDVLTLLQKAVGLLQSAASSGQTAFGPATLVSVDGVQTPFGVLAPYTVVFKPIAGGDPLTMKLQTDPRSKPIGAQVGQPYSGTWTPGSPVDTLNSLVPAALQVEALVLSIGSGPPIPVIFVPTAGGSQFTLNFQSLPAGIGPYKIVKFSYEPAAVNGTGFDQVQGTVAIVNS